MNKISKKIVALVTMAAFVLTLVPAAAFAAELPKTGDPLNSSIETAYANPDLAIGEAVKVTANIYASDNTTAAQMTGVKIWAEDKDGRITKAAHFYAAASDGSQGTEWNSPGILADGVVSGTLDNGQQFYVSFDAAGEYTIHVGQVQKQPDGSDKVVEVNYTEGYNTVNVAARTANSIKFTKEDGVSNLPTNEDNVVTLDILNNFAGFEINGVDTLTIKGKVTDKDGNPIDNATVNLASSKSSVVLKKTEVTTNNQGEFEVEFSMSDYVNATIDVTCGDLNYTLKVVASQSQAEDITTTLENGYVLAGNDSNWNKGDYRTFSDAVQFKITDKKGEAITSDLSATEPAFGIGNVAGYQHEDFVSVDDKPAKSTLTADDLIVVWDETNSVYTLKYKSGDAAKDLVPGEYTVSVALLSDDNATATFNVAKYGTTKDLVLNMYEKTTGKTEQQDPYAAITDEIALGSDLKVEAKYVDENGIKIPATKVEYGVDGKAVTGAYDAVQYRIAANTVANESLIGTTIYVKAYDSSVKKLVEKELTVVDAYNTYSLAFDPVKGDANKDNTVNVSVVDADENLANKVDGNLYAYVADQSNADAKVSVEVAKDVEDGKGKLTIFSDKETTVDVVVAVKSGTAIYAKTLEYTVGKEDALANTSVVMTIGSSDFVVNNQVVTMEDAAPYVANDRTYVPFRALGEALGAEVEWDNDARTVTYTLGDTKIVMTIGEKTYTVNGEEKTMDVAPEITSDRTYVPVRFVGEALGFKVTALYAADNTTASVVFQK